MKQMRKKRTMLLAGLALALSAGNGLAAETATVSTVDSQQLFKAKRLVTDPSKQSGANHQGAEEKITDARPVVQRPLLHWDSLEDAQRTQLAVKTSAAPLVVVHKAVPIIITAADVEAQEKAARILLFPLPTTHPEPRAMSSPSEFPLSEAPQSARKGLLPIAMVLFSFTFFTGTMFAGGKLGVAFSFTQMLGVVALGNLL